MKKFNNVPNHVAIIMDGNGRWAKQRNLIRTKGHEAAIPVALNAIKNAIDFGIKNLSLYAFSTENWKRPQAEVSAIMNYSKAVLRANRDVLNDWGAQIKFVGREQKMKKSILKEFKEAEELTKNNKAIRVNFCVNYGGRVEIVDAVNSFINDKILNDKFINDLIKSKNSDKPKIKVTEKKLTEYMYQPDMPPVDLMIRTSGEQRLSNFLLWQSSYAEIVFLPEYFPDFTRESFEKALEFYETRKRRFGGL